MSRHAKKGGKGHTNVKDLVVVAFLDDREQAREYETLLRLNDIPAVIKEQLDPSADGKTVAIMVPEDYLDEAHVVIESQDAYDDLCDFAMDEDDGLRFRRRWPGRRVLSRSRRFPVYYLRFLPPPASRCGAEGNGHPPQNASKWS
jgi:hypothetical protein